MKTISTFAYLKGEPYPGAPLKVYSFDLVNKSGATRTTTLRGYSVFSAARMLKGTGYRPVAISPCSNPIALAILEGSGK